MFRIKDGTFPVGRFPQQRSRELRTFDLYRTKNRLGWSADYCHVNEWSASASYAALLARDQRLCTGEHLGGVNGSRGRGELQPVDRPGHRPTKILGIAEAAAKEAAGPVLHLSHELRLPQITINSLLDKRDNWSPILGFAPFLVRRRQVRIRLHGAIVRSQDHDYEVRIAQALEAGDSR